MRVYNSLEEYVPRKDGAFVALGFFDGVHRGHRAVIGSCAAESGACPCVVFTFCESPAKALGRPAPPLLSSNRRKAAIMEEIGANEVIFADFNAVKALSPADFVRRILRDKLNARRVYCGFNYRFGSGGAGDTAALKTLCAEYGIAVTVQDPVSCGGAQASSSKIREAIAGGAIEQANEMLGSRYAVEGDIGSGNRIGTVMGFPTVNLPIPEGMTVPRYGVYASSLVIDGVRYRGATNIGVHPTVGACERPVCETFLLDFAGGDLYGRQAVCELIAFLRPEKRFSSIEALTEQVEKDCETIKKMSFK